MLKIAGKSWAPLVADPTQNSILNLTVTAELQKVTGFPFTMTAMKLGSLIADFVAHSTDTTQLREKLQLLLNNDANLLEATEALYKSEGGGDTFVVSFISVDGVAIVVPSLSPTALPTPEPTSSPSTAVPSSTPFADAAGLSTSDLFRDRNVIMLTTLVGVLCLGTVVAAMIVCHLKEKLNEAERTVQDMRPASEPYGTKVPVLHVNVVPGVPFKYVDVGGDKEEQKSPSVEFFK